MVLDESNNKVTESNISLNEEQEMEFISQIKPATLTMIASILSDMVYVEGGELILTNQNSQAFDLRRDASEKLKEVRADLDTAAKMIQKSKQDFKKANWESIGLIKEKDIKKVDEKKLSAEKGLEQLSEIKRKSEEEIEYYSSIISQNSNSKKTVSGFTPRAFAARVRAASKSSRAFFPTACVLEGLPQHSRVSLRDSFKISSSAGLVAAQSK